MRIFFFNALEIFFKENDIIELENILTEATQASKYNYYMLCLIITSLY